MAASSEVVFKHYPIPCLQNHGHHHHHHHHHASTISMSLMKSSDSSSELSSLLLLTRSSSSSSLSSSSSSSSSWLSRNYQFYGGQTIIQQQQQQQQQQGGFPIPNNNKRLPNPPQASNSQMMMMMMSGSGSVRIGKTQKWWEKGVQPNMIEISSAQHLVDSLSNAGDRLVVLAFFSPGCGGCKALHPKLCQLAEMNPDVQFLHVNYEEHKSMCYSLNVHVLPFFRFYRGAHGRLTSFSCTNATIKKFKDALAKHTPDRCNLGPAKGLEEKELLALSANKDLCFTYTPKPVEAVPVEEDEILAETTCSSTSSDHSNTTTLSRESEDNTLVVAWR